MADATMPVATTSRIIPLIMNESPNLCAALRAPRERTVWNELAKAAIARRTQPRKEEGARGVPVKLVNEVCTCVSPAVIEWFTVVTGGHGMVVGELLRAHA